MFERLAARELDDHVADRLFASDVARARPAFALHFHKIGRFECDGGFRFEHPFEARRDTARDPFVGSRLRGAFHQAVGRGEKAVVQRFFAHFFARRSQAAPEVGRQGDDPGRAGAGSFHVRRCRSRCG